MSPAPTPVAAVDDAVRVPGADAPYDTVHLRAHYPAAAGLVPAAGEAMAADDTLAPFPAVVLAGDQHVPQAAYGWLAVELARVGFLAITYSFPTPTGDGGGANGPGIDDRGDRPTVPTVSAILSAAADLGHRGPLAGLVDVSRAAVGGHGLGGTAALIAGDTALLPTLRAVFSYGGHLLLPPPPGDGGPGGVIEVAGSVPSMMVHGIRDRALPPTPPDLYEPQLARPEPDEPQAGGPNPVRRSYEEGVPGGRDDVFYVEIGGANHLSFAHPVDDLTVARYPDLEPAAVERDIRRTMATILSLFLRVNVRNERFADAQLTALLRSPPPLVAEVRRK